MRLSGNMGFIGLLFGNWEWDIKNSMGELAASSMEISAGLSTCIFICQKRLALVEPGVTEDANNPQKKRA